MEPVRSGKKKGSGVRRLGAAFRRIDIKRRQAAALQMIIMPIRETIQDVLSDLSAFTDPLDRLEYLVDRAKSMPSLSGADKIEENRIEGCMAQLWMTSSFTDGTCRFMSDSDSMVVKSISGLLCEIYSNATPQEILEHPPEFLAEAGVTSHLSANRRNALTQVWKKIRAFAEANR